MKQALVGIGVFFLILAAPVEAQHIFGRALMRDAFGGVSYASGFQMKWCKADTTPLMRPTSQCSATVTLGQFGDFSYELGQGTGWYFPYLWHDGIYWGSDSYPAHGPAMFTAGLSTQVQGSLESYPRAVPPTVVFPAEGAVNQQTTVLLQWTDGRIAGRERFDWPVTYDIWASGNEFPEIKVYDNIPCNNTPGSHTCQLAVTGLAYTARYQWRVVARMHSGPVIPQAGPDNSYYTSSATFHFSTQWDPTATINTIAAPSGHLLRAANGGGGAVTFTGGSSTYETQFQIIDGNGGPLQSGDSVHIRTNRNYYISAQNGGGAGVETQKWAMGYETWMIIRIAGFGTIGPGDQVAFRAFNGTHYLSASGGGGSSATASGATIGAWETFTFR